MQYTYTVLYNYSTVYYSTVYYSTVYSSVYILYIAVVFTMHCLYTVAKQIIILLVSKYAVAK